MKNSNRIKILIILCLVIYNLLSCNSDIKIGIPESTNSIKESTLKDFFLFEYSPSKKVFVLNDTIYTINETWTEKEWRYKNYDLDIENTGKISFVIHFNNDWVDRIGLRRENFDFNEMSYTRNKLIFYLNKNEINKDSINLYFLIDNDTIPVVFVKK